MRKDTLNSIAIDIADLIEKKYQYKLDDTQKDKIKEALYQEDLLEDAIKKSSIVEYFYNFVI